VAEKSPESTVPDLSPRPPDPATGRKTFLAPRRDN